MMTLKRANAMRDVKPGAGPRLKQSKVNRPKWRFLAKPGNPRPIPAPHVPLWMQGIAVDKTRIGFLTRNSRCLCGSGHRFKRCCMIDPKSFFRRTK